MKLVYLQNTDNAYVLKAEVTFKFLGVSLGRRSKIFIRKYSDKKWREEKSGKLASRKEKAYLNKWLSKNGREEVSLNEGAIIGRQVELY